MWQSARARVTEQWVLLLEIIVLPGRDRLAVRLCSSWIFVAVLKHSDQEQLGGRGFIGLILPGHIPSLREGVRQELKQELEAETTRGRGSLALSWAYAWLSFFCSLSPPAQRMVLPTVGLVLLHQLIIKSYPKACPRANLT